MRITGKTDWGRLFTEILAFGGIGLLFIKEFAQLFNLLPIFIPGLVALLTGTLGVHIVKFLLEMVL